MDANPFEKALGEKSVRLCASQELTTYSLTAPFGKGLDALLVHVGQDFFLISTRREERILPGSTAHNASKERVGEIETQQVYKAYKKERDRLKDGIVRTLLSCVFIRRSNIFATIVPNLDLILVDSAGVKKAEDLFPTPREVLSSLLVRPLSMEIASTATLTDRVKA